MYLKHIFILIFLCATAAGYAQDQDQLDRRVEALLAKMTLEEKVGQLNQYSSDRLATGPLDPKSDKFQEIKDGKVGSMLNIDGARETRMLQEMAMQSRLKIPLLFGRDVIHGYRVTFPVPLAEAASWDLGIIERSARIAATEAAAAGIHWTFAPMVDISRDPRWGRVVEGAGEDPYLGSLIAKARVRGFQGNKLGDLDAVMACAKHFAAYGAAIAGRDYNSVDMSDRQLWEVYLPPFKAAADAGVATFMNSFNDLNGIPATGSKYLQRDILKGRWNYDGFVVSDWTSIPEMVAHGYAKDRTQAAERAILAGSDMDMQGGVYISKLVQLVKEGKIPEALINDAVTRILKKKFEMGLFEDPFRYSNEQREKKVLNSKAHHEAALDAAKRSIVLLKNENQTLPLSTGLKKIAVIGPLANAGNQMRGAWTVYWPDDHMISLYEGLQNRLGGKTQLLYAKGCDVTDTSTTGFKEAIAVAQSADLVIMAMGERSDMSGEAKSRADISMPGVQEKLLKAIKKTGKKVVVLVMSGRPLIFNETTEQADALLYTWFLGSEAGNAMAKVLFGDYNPSGKLPITFPRAQGQIPIYYSYKSTGRPLTEDDNPYRSSYIDVSNKPAFAFGYGMSYTTFTMEDLQLSKNILEINDSLNVSVTVKNTGEYVGEEVVQLYLQDIAASVVRPVKELKDFKKIELKPNESKTVTFTINMEKLSFYNEQMQWGVEPGEFKLMIGNSSDHIVMEKTIELIN